MSWLKDVIVDIVISIFILTAVYLTESWMTWTVWVYTGLMLLSKGIVMLSSNFNQMLKKSHTEAPQWFAHMLYAINTFVLLYAGWWFASAGWALIWLFSYFTQRRLSVSKQQA